MDGNQEIGGIKVKNIILRIGWLTQKERALSTPCFYSARNSAHPLVVQELLHGCVVRAVAIVASDAYVLAGVLPEYLLGEK